jgi:hypothetical protein
MSADTLGLLRTGQLAGTRRLDLSCGLTEFPREIFDLADSLEVLNLSGNRLSSLPSDLPRLHRLRILFCSENDFDHLPAVLAQCEGLSMIGFKSNRIGWVEALPPSLRWLILTDNRLESLPACIGNCPPLQKLMLSGNRLASLPEELAGCRNLELARLAANRFESLPEWLLGLPKLAWLAFGGNPCSPSPEATAERIPWADLQLAEKLGEGASGVIHAARRVSTGQAVAVKVFKGSMTSDGLPDCERRACLAAGRHPHLIAILGDLHGHPDGAAGLVMERIAPEFGTLAGPPSLATCSRDVYAAGIRFSAPVLRRIARGLAAAGTALHAKRILHGDFYAHNVLHAADGHALLGDFGAASFYPEHGIAYERLEVLAFGRLLGEMLDRCPEMQADLRALQARCESPVAADRPSFAEVEVALRA